MRTINLNNFPIQNNGKKVSNGLMKLKAMNNTNSVDCLDSLRKNIQKEINDKFKSIIDEYTNVMLFILFILFKKLEITNEELILLKYFVKFANSVFISEKFNL